MKISKSPKPLRPAVPADRLQMVEQFLRSGLSRKAFSLRYGVPLATLSWWLSKAKRSSATSAAAVTFREVKVISAGGTPEKWAMEVESPSGVKVRCREALPVGTLERLVRGGPC
jgi:transposase-like protein